MRGQRNSDPWSGRRGEQTEKLAPRCWSRPFPTTVTQRGNRALFFSAFLGTNEEGVEEMAPYGQHDFRLPGVSYGRALARALDYFDSGPSALLLKSRGPALPSFRGFPFALTVNLEAARSPAPPAAAPAPGPSLQQPRWLGHRAPRLARLGLTLGGAQERPMELQAVVAAAAAGAATARADDAQARWGGARADDTRARAVSGAAWRRWR